MPVTSRSRISTKSYSTEVGYTEDVTVRRHKPDYMLVLYMGLLMLLGLVIMYAIGPQRANVLNLAYGSSYDDTYFFIKQGFSLLLALLAFIGMTFVPYRWLAKYSNKILIIAFASCALLAVAGWAHLGIAQQSLGATRWFNLGPLGSLQPSEFLKFAVLLFAAGFLGIRYKQGMINDTNTTLFPVAVIAALSMLFVVVIQKDLGTGLSLIGILMAMLFMAGLNKKNGLMIAITLLGVGLLLIFTAPHRIERIMTFLKGDNTSSSSTDESYHIEQAKLAIGTGGMFGVGIGNSVQATGYLPEAINDSLFAIMGEIFGFVGLMVILGIFIALLLRLLKIMDHLVDIRLKLLVAGVFGWFGAHVILNVGSMIGIFPLTGITLPLLSFGGTSMVFVAAALGTVFQLSRYTVYDSKLKEGQNENPSSRRGIGGSRYSGRSSFTRG